MSRLPVINQDEDVWGTILNDYLLVAHNPDGTQKSTVDLSTVPLLAPTVDTRNVFSGSAGRILAAQRRTGDTQNRFQVDTDGIHQWGSGAAVPDANLYRSAVDRLKTDDLLIAALGLQTRTKAGVPVDGDWAAAPADGTLAVDTTGNALYFRSGGAWRQPGAVPPLRKTSAKTVNNTVTETDLLNGEFTLAAGVLGTTGVARLTAFGDLLQNNGTQNFFRWKLKLGGTVLIDSGAMVASMGATAARYPWRVVAEIGNLGVANSQAVYVYIRGVSDAAFAVLSHSGLTTGEGAYNSNAKNEGTGTQNGSWAEFYVDGFNTAAIDTTTSKLLEFTVTLPAANVAVEAKLVMALVEFI